MSKLNPEKTCQNNPGRDPKWTKMLKKLTLDMPEISKLSQKVVFGGLDFLVSFGVPKKTKKYGKNGWEGEKCGRPGGMSKPLGRIIGGF